MTEIHPPMEDHKDPSPTDEEEIPVEIIRISRSRRKSKRRRKYWSLGFFLLSLAFCGFIGWIGYNIYDSALDLRGGNIAEAINDPSTPGYVASVLPTPLHLAAITDANGQLIDTMLFVEGSNDEAGEAGFGSVVWIVGETYVPEEAADVDNEIPSGRLREIYEGFGIEGLVGAVEGLVGFGIPDSVVLSPAELTAIGESVGPIEIDNPDGLGLDEENVEGPTFEKGLITIEPSQISDYLAFLSDNEVPTNRATRASALTLPLLEAFADADLSSAVPVLTSSGGDLADIFSTMGSALVEFVVLPVELNPDLLAYEVNSELATETLRDVVQLPISAFPGQRPRVLLLNGGGNLSAATAAIPLAVTSGGEVIQIGNAEKFDLAVTTVEFHTLSATDVANKIAEELGVVAEPTTETADVFDITVTLGADYTP